MPAVAAFVLITSLLNSPPARIEPRPQAPEEGCVETIGTVVTNAGPTLAPVPSGTCALTVSAAGAAGAAGD